VTAIKKVFIRCKKIEKDVFTMNADDYLLKVEERHAKMKLKLIDVWGNSDTGNNGMIVARSEQKCPVFKDIVPYKSVTVICDRVDYTEVCYWLSRVHGGGASKTLDMGNDKLAIRSDYQCW
jgi:hypothetical protein